MKSKTITYWAIISCIAILGLLCRIWVANQFSGVSGGDAYNYLSITQSILAGDNPFDNTKRLPGYPLLLVPFVLTEKVDIEYTMRLIQIVASVWIVAMVTLLVKSKNGAKIINAFYSFLLVAP